jgi:hypothetical protein
LRQDHPWGRFGNGSWREVRIVTETFDAEGNPADSSITHNKTTVQDVAADRVTLKVEVTVEVAGQRFPSEPQIITQGFAGQTVGQTVSVVPAGAETITIEGQPFKCETQKIEIAGGVTREVNLISFAPEHFPAILKRKSTMRDAADTKTMQEATSEVRAVDMTRYILKERFPREAFLVYDEQRNDRGRTTTWSWHVPDVPGEIVDQSSKKVDNEGRTVRRTALELVGFGVDGVPQDDSRPDTRRRARRARRR